MEGGVAEGSGLPWVILTGLGMGCGPTELAPHVPGSPRPHLWQDSRLVCPLGPHCKKRKPKTYLKRWWLREQATRIAVRTRKLSMQPGKDS